jgi:endonuclease-3 related protein
MGLVAGSMEVFARLAKAYGQGEWWPIDAAYHEANKTDWRFEVVAGAILTQNTSWTNVEQALKNLKARKLLSAKAVARADPATIREAVRPAGFYNQKTTYLQTFAKYLWTTYKDDLDPFFRQPAAKLRVLLLSFTGIGEETADAIMVYAANKPVFVVDAYARRLTYRLGWGSAEESYERMQQLWAKRLGDDPKSHARAHALIVEHSKRTCTAKLPSCPGCPLEPVCKRMGVDPLVYLKAAQSQPGAKPPR